MNMSQINKAAAIWLIIDVATCSCIPIPNALEVNIPTLFREFLYFE